MEPTAGRINNKPEPSGAQRCVRTMEGHRPAEERLVVPTDFARKTRDDLLPPSHYAAIVQPAGVPTGSDITGTPSSVSWMNPNMTPGPSGGDLCAAGPRLPVTQSQQQHLAVRRPSQVLVSEGDTVRGRSRVDPQSDPRMRPDERGEQWSRWEFVWHLEAEKQKAETERLKGQVEALKETAERYREEMRAKDVTLNRQNRDLEALQEELCKAKAEHSQIREQLAHSSMQREKINSQLERLKTESSEETAKLKRAMEMSKYDVQELIRKAEMSRIQAEEETKRQTSRVSEQLEEMEKKQEVQLQQLNASHCAELGAARKSNAELENKLQSMASEVLQLRSRLAETSAERDSLKEHLSQMGQAFETQSATLHSLRNYIGQVVPDREEKNQLHEAVEKLSKEKAALQKTTELLTVRLNSANEILALRDEKIVKKSLADPLVKKGSEGLHVLHLWREKVFKLCVQLRSKDIELRGEKDKLLSTVSWVEQQLQQEQHRAGVLQHSLDARTAELDLEKVEKESLKQDLAQILKENLELKSQIHKAETDFRALTETVQRFSLAFENKVREVDGAQAKLNTLSQRLTFAQRRVETTQGLVMRRTALQRVQQANKQAEQADGIRNLQTELSFVCGERDKLTQELKRTPELIEKALADVKEEYESKLRQQQQQLEQLRSEAQQAVAAREEDQRNLQSIMVQLEASKVDLEKLGSELHSQKEHSEKALRESASEIEDRCAKKLREMEAQVDTAKREHSKAVMSLQQFQRQSHRRSEVQRKQLKETAVCKNLLLVSGADTELTSEFPNAHTTLQNPAVPAEQREKLSESIYSGGVQLPAAEGILSIFEELQSLCVSVSTINSSEDPAEEERHSHSRRPLTSRTADT